MTSPVASRTRGFFGSLYDLSFHSFVTPKIVQILYVIALICVGLWSIFWLFAGFFMPAGLSAFGYTPNPALSAFTLFFHVITAPIFFVLGSILARIYLELIIATFRIVENTESLRTRQ